MCNEEKTKNVCTLLTTLPGGKHIGLSYLTFRCDEGETRKPFPTKETLIMRLVFRSFILININRSKA
jgi:hypothetical protein